MVHCCICLDEAIIPVSVTIFPCYSATTLHCFSLQKLCESCAIAYLELDRPAGKRDPKKKCLFCRKEIDLNQIIDRPYRMDHESVTVADDHHRSDARNPVKDTDQTDSDICVLCRIDVNDMKTHVEIEHGIHYCPVCKKPTYLPLNEHDQQECPRRQIKCAYCPRVMEASRCLEHLLEHAKECKTRISLLHQLSAKETLLFERLTDSIQTMFETLYGNGDCK